MAPKIRRNGAGSCPDKRVVEMHGGNIWFESDYEKGSIFYFALPLKAQLRKSKTKRDRSQTTSNTDYRRKGGKDDHGSGG